MSHIERVGVRKKVCPFDTVSVIHNVMNERIKREAIIVSHVSFQSEVITIGQENMEYCCTQRNV